VTPAGVVTTLAGLDGNWGSADGTGIAARFYGPSGVAVDSAGIIYVADHNNNIIRMGHPENVPAAIITAGSGFGFNASQFGFTLTGPAGQVVVVEASTDLVNWSPVWTNSFQGTLPFSDPQ